MPFDEILKRHVKQFFQGTPGSRRDQLSLEDELHEELRTTRDKTIGGILDPGREEREAAQRAAELEEIRTQVGLGQVVSIDGRGGQWEAVELALGEADTATFSLVDRQTGSQGQLGATDDGSVVLDLPDDQFSGRLPGAFWHSDGAVGIRLEGVELRSDDRLVQVTCDLRAEL
ncbi:hypothetical protein BH23CHL8_BH23CHL8_29120 [soil metagenome]